VIVRKQSGSLFPRERLSRPRRRIPIHDHFALGFYYQFLVRFLNSEKAKKVPEIVHPLGACCWGRLDAHLAPRHLVVQQRPGLQARDMVSD
jgi:hypothetical protein